MPKKLAKLSGEELDKLRKINRRMIDIGKDQEILNLKINNLSLQYNIETLMRDMILKEIAARFDEIKDIKDIMISEDGELILKD